MLHYTSSFANAISSYANTHVVASKRFDSYFHDCVTFHLIQTDNLRTLVGQAYSTIRSVNPDVIHITAENVWNIPVIVRFCRYPLVITLHDPVPHKGMERPIFDAASNWTADQCADCILVHGPTSKAMAKRAGYDTTIHTITHGMYDHFGDPEPRTFDEIDNTILFFGNVRPNKGYDLIPDLVDTVSQDIPDVTAVVAGSSDVASQIDSGWVEETMSALWSHDSIVVNEGFIPDDQVRQYFVRSKVVVLPYRDGSQSGVGMIARAMNRPVVATDVGDIQQVVDHKRTGFVVDANDVSELATRVCALLTERATWREFVRNIRITNECYTWDTVASNVAPLYKDLVSDSDA